MTLLPLIEDARHLPTGFRLVKAFDNKIREETEGFFVTDSFLVIHPFPPPWDQLVVPLSAIRAIYEHLLHCLRPKPGSDDFPWNWTKEFAGEELGINRGMCLGGEGIAGYTVSNFSRGSYISPMLPQSHSFLDAALLEGGQLDFLGQLASRYEAGEFKNL